MKKKVLIIVENIPVPFDRRVWKESVSLKQNGYEVSVLCPRGKNFKQGYELLEGIHIYRHPMPEDGNGVLGYFLEYGCALLWQFIYSWWIYFRRGFDIIQGCNPPDNIFLVALPFKIFGVKYIFDHHDVIPELYLSKYERKDLLYKVQVWLEKMTYRFADVVMATNNSYKEIAMTRGGFSPEDVFVVRNGPDLDTFKAVPPVPSLKNGKPYLVGYVGNMGAQEGLDILLEAVAHIRSLGRNDVYFICVGGGPALAGLRQAVKVLALEDTVTFTGRIPDKELLEILSTADLCVNPDKPCMMNDLSTMIKITEYMALGKPIVQFDLKEGRFSAMEASLYADDTKGAKDFGEKILRLLDDPKAREEMGRFGRARIEQALAWEFSVPHLLAAYERVLNKN